MRAASALDKPLRTSSIVTPAAPIAVCSVGDLQEVRPSPFGSSSAISFPFSFITGCQFCTGAAGAAWASDRPPGSLLPGGGFGCSFFFLVPGEPGSGGPGGGAGAGAGAGTAAGAAAGAGTFVGAASDGGTGAGAAAARAASGGGAPPLSPPLTPPLAAAAAARPEPHVARARRPRGHGWALRRCRRRRPRTRPRRSPGRMPPSTTRSSGRHARPGARGRCPHTRRRRSSHPFVVPRPAAHVTSHAQSRGPPAAAAAADAGHRVRPTIRGGSGCGRRVATFFTKIQFWTVREKRANVCRVCRVCGVAERTFSNRHRRPMMGRRGGQDTGGTGGGRGQAEQSRRAGRR